MSFSVYILQCSDGSFYTGHTDNLEARLNAHESAQVPGYTQTRMPVALKYVEEYPARVEAIQRERQIKGWSRRKKKALIENNWGNLIAFSRSRGSTSSPRTGI